MRIKEQQDVPGELCKDEFWVLSVSLHVGLWSIWFHQSGTKHDCKRSNSKQYLNCVPFIYLAQSFITNMGNYITLRMNEGTKNPKEKFYKHGAGF